MNPHENDVLNMLKGYAQKNPVRFHMPGHKGALNSEFDVTEISKTDDLTSPENALLKLEKRFATVYGAKHSFLLVNGSTSGIHAFLLLLGTNKKIVVSRECHRSIVHGAALCDHELIFTKTQELSEIEAALKSSNADAVILTSPTYYGECADVSAISEVVHENGAMLFVDAAHGAHFPFSDKLPHFESEKVDMWCTSTHKTLNSLTQSAVLHMGKCCNKDIEEVRRKLMLENTSSPSFLLMMSLEKALNDAEKDNAWDGHIERILNVKKRFESEFKGVFVENTDDITRLVINVSNTGKSGYEVMQFLEEENIFIECADEKRLVLITTPSDSDEWYDMLIKSLKQIDSVKKKLEFIEKPSAFLKRRMSIREAVFSESEYVKLEESEGRVLCACVGVYPPGSPCVAPGEEMSFEAIEYLKAHLKLFGDVYGILNGTVPCVKE